MKNIAVLASGSGTNAENLVRYFKGSDSAEIRLILSNNKDAYVLTRAKNLEVPCDSFIKTEFYETDQVIRLLESHQIDVIVLAGFLWLVPENLIEAFPNRIINIHPALLPKYGGKGMYGRRVHEAVIKSGEVESGITIHVIDKEYDRGITLIQAKCEVRVDDTADTLAQRIHQLEYEYFPKTVDSYIKQL